MKLYTDPGNFQTVKVLVAAELGGFKLEIQTVKSDGKYLFILLNVRTPKHFLLSLLNELCPEKTCLGFRPGPTQTRLYNHIRLLEA